MPSILLRTGPGQCALLTLAVGAFLSPAILAVAITLAVVALARAARMPPVRLMAGAALAVVLFASACSGSYAVVPPDAVSNAGTAAR